MAEVTDEELRARWRPMCRPVDLLTVALTEAAFLLDPPRSMRGETIGEGHVRIFLSADCACCYTLERMLRDRFPLTWRVDVEPEPRDAKNPTPP